jgi:hypothetical protein
MECRCVVVTSRDYRPHCEPRRIINSNTLLYLTDIDKYNNNLLQSHNKDFINLSQTTTLEMIKVYHSVNKRIVILHVVRV